jgi:hypothetical protein
LSEKVILLEEGGAEKREKYWVGHFDQKMCIQTIVDEGEIEEIPAIVADIY